MIQCCCAAFPLLAVVKDCDGSLLAGASVTAVMGGTTLGPLTTSGAGTVNFGVQAAGTWVVTASKAGFQTMSVTIVYDPATGATATIDYKLFAPATLTLTSGGVSTTVARFVSGSSYGYVGTGSYSGASYASDSFGNCSGPGSTIAIFFNFSCTNTGYSATFVPCPAPPARNYSSQSPGTNIFVASRSNTATITSFSISPFLITGTWAAMWNEGHNPNIPDPGLVGSSFTIS